MVKIKINSEEEQTVIKGGSVLKKNVNVFLLILVMAIIAIGVSYTVIYQGQLAKISDTAKNTTDNLTMCVAELSATKSSLDSAISRLNQTERDVKTYDVIYEQKETELDTTKEDLAEVQKELETKKVLLDRSEGLYVQAKEQADKLTKDYATAQATIAKQNTDITSYKQRINCLLAKEGSAEDDC
ncbi:MAG: hypothetical protein ABIJ21_04890 [Nanoarchaeota archaeon]